MDSIKIQRLLERLIDPRKCFVAGVFPREMTKLTNFKMYPGCCIANIDKSTQPGKHWVAFYVSSPYDYEFFDSYGLSPSDYGFNYELCNPTSFNSLTLQSELSNTCGHFCLYFLHSKSIGFPMSIILRSFSLVNLRWNDKLLRKFVSKISNCRAFYNNPHIPLHSKQISLVKKFVNRF